MQRIEVSLKSRLPDARGQGLVKDINDLGIITITGARVVDIYWLDAELAPDKLETIGQRILADPVTQEYRSFSGSGDKASAESGGQSHTIEVAYNAGVADPVEETVMKAMRDLGIKGVKAVRTTRRYLLKGRLSKKQGEEICGRLLVNPIIQHILEPGQFTFPKNPQYRFKLSHIDLLGMDAAELAGVRRRFSFTED